MLGCTNIGAGNPPSLTDTAGTACFTTEGSPVFSGVQAAIYWSSTTGATIPNTARAVVASHSASVANRQSPANDPSLNPHWPVANAAAALLAAAAVDVPGAPAISYESDGVTLVYGPDEIDHLEQGALDQRWIARIGPEIAVTCVGRGE